jgi:prepilin-type N-terminal cleavage/methylation domain-containing protein
MHRKAFTLIELLVVIGVLSILLTIVLIAINPARQFNQANNTKRRSDIVAILDAIHQYGADHRGVLPTGIGNVAQEIASGAGNSDICADLVDNYLPALPLDPETGDGASVVNCADPAGYATGYTVTVSAGTSRVTVAAPDAKLGEIVAITR